MRRAVKVKKGKKVNRKESRVPDPAKWDTAEQQSPPVQTLWKPDKMKKLTYTQFWNLVREGKVEQVSLHAASKHIAGLLCHVLAVLYEGRMHAGAFSIIQRHRRPCLYGHVSSSRAVVLQNTHAGLSFVVVHPAAFWRQLRRAMLQRLQPAGMLVSAVSLAHLPCLAEYENDQHENLHHHGALV